MIYYCKECKELIEEDELEEKDEGYYTEFWGSKVYHSYITTHCPYCGSEKIEEAPQCEECGEYFVPNECFDCICKDCYEEKK